jgi:2-hydroxy-3-oxopropionate reductase
MAKNLLKAGYPLVVHSRSEGPVQELVGAGAKAASSCRDVAAQVDVLITMLPNSPDVELAALGKDGIIEGARRGLLYLDMSTISPLVSQKVGTALAERGVRMLDAPVSGGEKGAVEATLSIMVGGDRADLDPAMPVLQAMGKTITHLGPLGAGGFTKLANQIIVAANIEALSEALVLAQKAGVDPERVFNAIRGGLAGSAVMEAKAPMMMDRNFRAGFRIRLHQKDLRNVLQTAQELNVPLPVTALVQQMLGSLVNDGEQELDHSAILHFIEKMAHVEVKKGG